MRAHDNKYPPQNQKVPPHKQVPMGDEVSVYPTPPMTDEEIRSAFLILAQAMTLQDKYITYQVQAMKDQVNHEVGRRMQHYSSHLRDITRMNPLMFFGSKVDEDPQDFLDEDYKIVFAMGVTINENVKLAS